MYKKDYPDIAGSLNNLGVVCQDKGQYDQALNYHKKALAIYNKIYKEDHPDIAMSLNNLGFVYQDKGQYDEALKYYKKALAIRKRIDKEDHPDVALLSQKIGLICLYKGQYSDAFKYYNQSLKAYRDYDHYKAIPALDGFRLLFDKFGYKYKADSYLKMKKFISSPDDFLDKPIISLSSEDIEQTSSIITKLPVTLNSIAKKADKANWSSGLFVDKPSLLGDWGVKGFTSDIYIKEMLGDLCSTNNMKLAKLLCFEAICLGIASQSSAGKNYKCLDEFIKINPGIADIVLKQHPEYFVNTNLLQHCKEYIQDKKLWGEVLESANNRFKVSEVEVKNEDMEDEENIIITNDYDENNEQPSTLFGEEFTTE